MFLALGDFFLLSKPYDTSCFLLNTCHHKGKGKTVPVHATEAYRGSNGIVPLILKLDTTVNHHNLIFKEYIFINPENMRANGLKNVALNSSARILIL
jgi:hypothetical protein